MLMCLCGHNCRADEAGCSVRHSRGLGRVKQCSGVNHQPEALSVDLLPTSHAVLRFLLVDCLQKSNVDHHYQDQYVLAECGVLLETQRNVLVVGIAWLFRTPGSDCVFP